MNKQININMEPEEITTKWVKENLFMVDGNDIVDCYSEDTIKYIAWRLRCLAYLNYKDVKEVLNQFHLIIKQK